MGLLAISFKYIFFIQPHIIKGLLADLLVSNRYFISTFLFLFNEINLFSFK